MCTPSILLDLNMKNDFFKFLKIYLPLNKYRKPKQSEIFKKKGMKRKHV